MSETTAIELTIMSGPEDGATLNLTRPKQGDSYVIGRREDCDVILPYDSQISRQHATLSLRDGTWYLQDLGSRNGTFIGKHKIEGQMPLEPGQMFRIGRTWMRLKKASGED